MQVSQVTSGPRRGPIFNNRWCNDRRSWNLRTTNRRDDRMSLAKVLLIILLFGNTGSYNQPSEADYTTREYLPAAHRMGELGVRTIQRRIQNTPRGPAKEPCLGQHAAYCVIFLYQHVKEHRSFSRKSDAKVTKKKVTPLLYLCQRMVYKNMGKEG